MKDTISSLQKFQMHLIHPVLGGVVILCCRFSGTTRYIGDFSYFDSLIRFLFFYTLVGADTLRYG